MPCRFVFPPARASLLRGGRAASELQARRGGIERDAQRYQSGIVGLEQALGVELFVREPRGLSLTPAGADYLSYVSEAFSLIAIGTQRLPNNRPNRTIALSCAPTLASRWLLPRLQGFRARWPNANVTVDTSHRQVGFPVDGFDFAIRMSRAPVAGTAWTRLFGERLVPVCSPAYRESLLDEQGNVDLRRATLIHVNAASEDWQAWFEATGATGTTDTTGSTDTNGIDLSDGLRVDTIQLAFEAAAMGLGVALGRRPLVDRDLASHALVEASPQTIGSTTAYWLVSSESADHRPELFDFKRWLLTEAEHFDHSPAVTDAGPRSANN